MGTNGRQMSLILGVPLAARGFETVAIDNLGYGLTQVKPGTTPSYDDWVDLVNDFVAYERTRDVRPIVLYGLSAGGMLTYHVAAKAPTRTLSGIVGMAFLDPHNKTVRDATAHNKLAARFGGPMMGVLAKSPAASIRFPMSLALKMSILANDPAALKVLRKDRTSAASWVSVGFLNSFMNYSCPVEPEEFDACPVLLTQPAEDHGSPLSLSTPFLSRITKVPVETTILDGAGHYPLEEPGLTQMQDAIAAFVTAHTN
jgi:pimeloyl-ACP methyl ester carboxylesterase